MLEVPHVTHGVIEDMMYAPMVNFGEIPLKAGQHVSLQGHIRKVLYFSKRYTHMDTNRNKCIHEFWICVKKINSFPSIYQINNNEQQKRCTVKLENDTGVYVKVNLW